MNNTNSDIRYTGEYIGSFNFDQGLTEINGGIGYATPNTINSCTYDVLQELITGVLTNKNNINLLNTYSYSSLTVANTDYFKDSGCFVCKVGNQVNIQIQINVIKGYTAWSDLLVTTIPSGYRPRRGLVKTVYTPDGFNGALRIESNGTVKLQSFNGLTGNFIFENLSYSI